MKNTKLRKKLRKDINGLGIKVVRYFPKRKCRKLAADTLNVHWVLKESFGFVMLNLSSLKTYNTIKQRLKLTKLRSRDLNKICKYRFPLKVW